MNLNSHILLALAVAMALFHRVDLAILVGIGAAIPDLDREYVFTRRKFFRTHQLHRALLHNLFFVGALAAFNQYLGLGALLHVTLDMLTSPADRGVEILFPLTRLVRRFKLDLEGKESNEMGGFLWYVEDPVRLVRKVSDPGLREGRKVPWSRVYGPFKNGRLADWTVFYSSVVFIILLTQLNGGFIPWLKSFLIQVFGKFLPLEMGIVLFYTGGELWRRRLQFSGRGKRWVITLMIIGAALIIFQGAQLYHPSSGWISYALLGSISTLVGGFIAFAHVRLRRGEVVI